MWDRLKKCAKCRSDKVRNTKNTTGGNYDVALKWVQFYVLYWHANGPSFMACQQSWITLAGVSPVTVIASEPCSETWCVAVMQGAKRSNFDKRSEQCKRSIACTLTNISVSAK